MEHFITKIQISELRHLKNIEINLNQDKRQHLILTGKNGAGKTTVLLAIKQYLQAINDGCIKSISLKYSNGLKLLFNYIEDLDAWYQNGDFITGFFPAGRISKMEIANGVQDVKLNQFYTLDDKPGNILLKYMVHLKTQQSYARNEGDTEIVKMIQHWFDRVENAFKVLLDNDSISLEYDYKNYSFKFREAGRESFGFDQLSDGYSSVIHIVSDLIIRMDRNWLLNNKMCNYNMEGVVLIDELETHLHIELQRKILPFLTEFFPRIQFVITTHSPYILNSVSNAKIYDLEKNIELEDLSVYSSEDIVEGYFESDEYSDELKNKVKRYEELVLKQNLSDEERAERAALRIELKNMPENFVQEIEQAFENIENRRS